MLQIPFLKAPKTRSRANVCLTRCIPNNTLVQHTMESAMQTISVAAAKAINTVRIETSNMVIDKLLAFLGEKIEVDDQLKANFEEFRALMREEITSQFAVPTATSAKIVGKKGATKAPVDANAPMKPLTINNLFVQDEMANLKAKGHKADPVKGNLLKQATTVWREMSDQEKQEYEDANCDRLAAINKERAENPEKCRAEKRSKTKVAKAAAAPTQFSDAESAIAPAPPAPAPVKQNTKPVKASPKPAKKETKAEPSTSTAATSDDEQFTLEIAKTFLRVFGETKFTVGTVKRVNRVLNSTCKELIEEFGQEVDDTLFMDALTDALTHANVLIGTEDGDKVMEKFRAMMQEETDTQTSTNQNGEEDPKDDEEDAADEDDEEDAADEDDEDYY